MSTYAESECIYNILGKKNKKKQEGLYKSKYPHNIAPTGSTFINKNTTRPGVANLAGEFKLFKGGHEYKFQTQTFGKPKGESKLDPKHFQKRGDTQQNPNDIFRIKKGGPYKDPVPKFVQGEDFNQDKENEQKKNFIVSNAIDIAMMEVPIRKTQPLIDYKQKDYGKVPKYLETVKNDIEKEYRVYQKNMRILRGETESTKSNQPTKEDLIKRREKLKDQWTETYNKYSKMAHKTKFDTLIEKEKKAGYEKELNQLEVEIRNLKTAIQKAQK
ncbi:hypothetical protein ABPG74_000106 [Tetrahymena malaccensis]